MLLIAWICLLTIKFTMFTVSQLKPYTPDFTLVFSDITKLVDLSVHTPQPEAILERCLVKKGNIVIPQVLICTCYRSVFRWLLCRRRDMGGSVRATEAFSAGDRLGTSSYSRGGRCHGHTTPGEGRHRLKEEAHS